MLATRLIDPADRIRLEEAVIEAERATTGEIVVVVTGACDEYGSAGWRLGAVLAALAYLAVALFAPPATISLVLAVQAAALLLGHVLARLEPIRRMLLSESLVAERVEERARRAFAENGLERTAGRTGILLFVTLLERRVVVRADEGIHRVLGPGESWDEVARLAVDGLRRGQAAEGLLGAIRRCGEILAAHVPGPSRNLDELPNAIVLQDR